MTNTFLILTDIYNEQLRIKADSITSYKRDGIFTQIYVDGINYDVQHTVEQIDAALTEIYFMIKPVEMNKT